MSDKERELEKQIAQLKEHLRAEEEWKPYVDTSNVRQEDYEKLVQASDTCYMTDEEVKSLLYDWYGFSMNKIVIRKSVGKFEVNRHRRLHKIGEIDRRPAYNATDWNYARFDCGMMSYELYNGDLRFYVG